MKDIGEANKEVNRQKLIDQNKKLRSEILTVAREIDDIIKKKSMSLVFNQTEEQQYQKKRKDLIAQEQYILKLKTKIHQIKSTMVMGSDSLIRRQQDKVIQLRKQQAKLIEEKQTITRFKNDKQRLLKIRDEPHEQHLSKIQELLVSTKLQNRELLERIVPLERIVRREHQLNIIMDKAQHQKQLDKIENIDHVIADLQLEIKSNQQLKRSIEDKWNDRIENLDKTLFQLRGVYESKQKKHDELIKQLRNWETKTHNLRDEENIKQIKERLAKIVAKPKIIATDSKFILNDSGSDKKNQTTKVIRKIISKQKSSQLLGDGTNESFLLDNTDINSLKKLQKKNQKSILREQHIFQGKPQSPRKEVQQQTIQHKERIDQSIQVSIVKSGRLAWTPHQLEKNQKKKGNSKLQQTEFIEEIASHDLQIQKNQKKERKLLKSVAVGPSFIEH